MASAALEAHRPPPPAPGAAWTARLDLEFARRGGGTVLASCRHEGPLRVQKALHPEGPGICHAIVLHPPSGLVGGDELRIHVRAGERCDAVLTTPGAARWYRSTGAAARQRVRLDLGAGACAEWLPHENIVFDGARADMAWEARLAPDARLIAWDLTCLGRTGSGERFERGAVRLSSTLRRAGSLAWIERGEVVPAGAVARSPAGLGARSVFGTMIVAAPAIEDAWLAAAREQMPARGEAAVTRLPGVLLARYLGDSGEAAREYFVALWRRLRAPVLGRAPVPPRIWST